MEEKLAAGIDLRDDVTQLSFLREGMKEPESVSMVLNESKYLIPTVLAKCGKDFYIGEEAIRQHENSKCLLVDRLLSRVIAREENILESYGAQELLGIFFFKLFSMIPTFDGVLHKVVCAIEKENPILMDAILECMKDFKIQKKDLILTTQADCAIYYAISQERSLWQNDVYFFDFSDRGFCCRRLKVERIAQNMVPEFRAILEEKWYTEQLNMEMLNTEEGKAAADERLYKLVEDLFGKSQVCCVYLVGEGFYKEGWTVKSLPLICYRRRAFMGRNLYTKGACYAAWDQLEEQNFRHYRIECQGHVPSDIGVWIQKKKQEEIIWLAKAGSRWHEVCASFEGILDDCTSITYVIRDPITGEQVEEKLSCEAFPILKSRMMRVEVFLTFISPKKAVLCIKDLGFGNFIPGSKKVVSREIIF